MPVQMLSGHSLLSALSGRSSQVVPCISQPYMCSIPVLSMHCHQRHTRQQAGLHRQQTAAAPYPHQPDRVDVRAASSSRSSSGSSSSSSSSSSSGASSSGSFGSAVLPTAFKKHGITGDGSCMFRACVQGDHYARSGSCMPVREEGSKAAQLRKDVVEGLRNSREEMEPFLPGIADDFEGYLAAMSQPGVWGGEPELLMASRVLKRPICVYQSTWGGPQLIVTYSEDLLGSTEPMHLLWSGTHYDLLLPKVISKL